MSDNEMNQVPENEEDYVVFEDDDGNEYSFSVVDYFFYNGEEYAILAEAPGDANTAEVPESVDCYVVKVNTFTDEQGEEMEELVPVEDEQLEARLMEIASTRLSEDEEEN